MENHIAFFEKLDRRSVLEAGGKGANLGELARAGFTVPPGFVVLSSAFDRYLEETDLNVEIDAVIDSIKDLNDVNFIDRSSNEIRALIAGKRLPLDLRKEISQAVKKLPARFFAVRSSATAEDSKIASWAGELESYLFVQPTDVSGMVQRCWSSLFTPRALFYRFEKKLHKTRVSVGVVVQAMIDSEVSGVAFSVHPVSRDPDHIIIEAGWGLGEALVSGKITPDSYVVNKRAETLLDVNVSEQAEMIVRKKGKGTHTVPVKKNVRHQQKLSGKQIITLTKIIKRIEKHYKSPQDIEWALVKNKFYIIQTRPITTLN